MAITQLVESRLTENKKFLVSRKINLKAAEAQTRLSGLLAENAKLYAAETSLVSFGEKLGIDLVQIFAEISLALGFQHSLRLVCESHYKTQNANQDIPQSMQYRLVDLWGLSLSAERLLVDLVGSCEGFDESQRSTDSFLARLAVLCNRSEKLVLANASLCAEAIGISTYSVELDWVLALFRAQSRQELQQRMLKFVRDDLSC